MGLKTLLGLARPLAALTVICLILPVGFSQGAGHDIPSFVACLNARLSTTGPNDVSNSVQCIPDGCKLTVTMSQESAQPACIETPAVGVPVQLPRIILSCPGPAGSEWQRFRPSYLLCATPSALRADGWNRIEIGSDQTPSSVNNLAAINMRMAEIVIPPGQPWTRITDPNTVIAQSCAKCHAKTPPGNDNSLDQIIDSFGTFKSKQGDNNNNLVLLRSLLIDTTEPTKIPLVTQTPPAPGVTRQNIAAICTILNNQASNANKNLCTNLKDYQNSRSCGVGLPNVTCGGINGGGMFRNDQLIGGDNSLSVISFDVSGQAQKGTTTYTFLDTEGNLTAYNYQSRNCGLKWVWECAQ